MELTENDINAALAKTRDAWRRSHPHSPASEMPMVLREESTMTTLAGRRPLSAAEARAHAARHLQPVAGCEYCADREPPKLAKAADIVQYRAAGDDATERCGACRFYGFGSCNLVEGSIAASDVCDLFQPPIKIFLPESTTYSAGSPARRKEPSVATTKTRDSVRKHVPDGDALRAVVADFACLTGRPIPTDLPAASPLASKRHDA